MNTPPYSIGELARAARVSVEAIRYYQRRDLIEVPHRPPGGIRRYTNAHARKLRFIKEAQFLGFSLDEVADLLALDDGRQCAVAAELGRGKLSAVQARIAQLRRIEVVLTSLLDECRRNAGHVRCPLIAGLDESRIGHRVV